MDKQFLIELRELLNKYKVKIEPCSCMFNCGRIEVIPASNPVSIFPDVENPNQFMVLDGTS